MVGFRAEVVSAAPPEDVFDLIADAPGWASWAGPTVPGASWEAGTPGGVGGVRVLGRWPLAVREQVVVHERPHSYAYLLLTGHRLHRYRADVTLERLPDGGTRVVWEGRVRTPVPGPDRVLALALDRLVGDYARRAARAAEA